MQLNASCRAELLDVVKMHLQELCSDLNTFHPGPPSPRLPDSPGLTRTVCENPPLLSSFVFISGKRRMLKCLLTGWICTPPPPKKNLLVGLFFMTLKESADLHIQKKYGEFWPTLTHTNQRRRAAHPYSYLI